MELGGITDYLKDKSILVTGSTGFLGKIFVEKVLRVQPNVKKLFLLVRATPTVTAAQRVQSEVIDKELFNVLREKHAKDFNSFISNKVSPIAGDITYENLGVNVIDGLLERLQQKIDIIVNVAAATKFDERYDVALGINVLGAKHVIEFAKRCAHLQMLLHVSTAYVANIMEQLILEKPFHLGEALKDGMFLDIQSELRLVEEQKEKFQANKSSKDIEKRSMKEIGLIRARYFGWPNTYVFTKAMGEMLLGHLRGNLPLVIVRPTIITSIYKEPLPGWTEGARTIDASIIGYAKGKLAIMNIDTELIMDVVPGDMVVNAMIVTMAAHSSQESEFIYQIGSSTSKPVKYSLLHKCLYEYFLENPRVGTNGEIIKTTEVHTIKSKVIFHGCMMLQFRIPLEVLNLMNLALCGLFSKQCHELNRKSRFVMRFLDLYRPYMFFKGCIDDTNAEKLRRTMVKENSMDAKIFDFDPKHINWEDYFLHIHIPGVLKYGSK